MQQKNQAERIYTKKWIKVPANAIITMICKTNLGILYQRMLLALRPNNGLNPILFGGGVKSAVPFGFF